MNLKPELRFYTRDYYWKYCCKGKMILFFYMDLCYEGKLIKFPGLQTIICFYNVRRKKSINKVQESLWGSCQETSPFISTIRYKASFIFRFVGLFVYFTGVSLISNVLLVSGVHPSLHCSPVYKSQDREAT